MTDVQVTLSGPLFDGRAQRIMDAAGVEAEDAVAQYAVNEIRSAVASRAKHSTGRFASHVVTERRSADRFTVHPRGLRYSAWLEGTSRRNARSTFKGFRPVGTTREDLRGRAPAVAGQVIARRVKEING